jgi:peptidoglycan/xylan/chitin deacetylase (PgdA/CDA1 family)
MTLRTILTFHSIDESGSVLSYSAKSFAKLLDALERCDIPIVDLDTLLRAQSGPAVTLTFDDGIRTVFTQALPILRSHSAPAHLFLTTNSVGGTNRWPSQPRSAPLFEMLRWSEVEALQAGGVQIEAHTANHPDMRTLNDGELRSECEMADEAILAKLGHRVRYFAYPYSYSDERVRAFARSRYKASLVGGERALRDKEDSAALPRLNSYYLQPEWILRDLRSWRTRAYLEIRGAIRRLRTGF